LTPTKHIVAGILLAGAVFATAPAIALAQGEHARRAAVELLVITGDARRLAEESPRELHRKGLADRIRGGLSGLDLMLRLADEEQGKEARSYASEVIALREALTANDLAALRALASDLLTAHPFRASGILPARATPERLERGKALHEELCAGCHDTPDTQVERPAYNLYEEARSLPALEFAARMTLGVRGDRVTGIDNPLSDEQIASLIAWYREGPADR
jgi:cytochrome c553